MARKTTSSDSPENYAYINARLRSRGARFFSSEELRRLADGVLEDLEVALLDGRYAEVLRSRLVTSERSAFRRVEKTLSLGTAQSFDVLRRRAEGETAVLVDILLARADFQNARLMLRSMTSPHRSPKEMPFWASFGVLSPALFGELWESHDLQEFASRCRGIPHPFGGVLWEASQDLMRHGSLPRAERHLLLGYLEFLRRALDPWKSSGADRVREYLGRLADVWNSGIWLRERAGYLSASESAQAYVPGGACLSLDRLRRSSTLEALVSHTCWRDVARRGAPFSPHRTQQRFAESFLRWQASLFRKDLLGIDVGIGFIGLQLLEEQNLNRVAVGMALGLPSRRIQETLLFMEPDA